MKIVVLGGSGFVGKNMVELLNTTRHEIISLSRSTGLDLLDYDSTAKKFSEINPDIIINLAALVGSLNFVTVQAVDIFDNNMRMLLNVFKAVQKSIPDCYLIHPIANCGYPGDISLYKEKDFWSGEIHKSVLSYGSTRRMIDVLSKCYEMQYKLKMINYFVPNMYGPYESTDPDKAHALDALVSKVVKAKNENKSDIEVWGSGVAIREWLYVKDFAKIIKETIANIDKIKIGESINIAQNFGLSVRELIEIIIKYSGYSGKITWNKKMPDGAPIKIMCNEIFKTIFPDFEFTSLEEGIKATIKYYQSVYPY